MTTFIALSTAGLALMIALVYRVNSYLQDRNARLYAGRVESNRLADIRLRLAVAETRSRIQQRGNCFVLDSDVVLGTVHELPASFNGIVTWKARTYRASNDYTEQQTFITTHSANDWVLDKIAWQFTDRAVY